MESTRTSTGAGGTRSEGTSTLQIRTGSLDRRMMTGWALLVVAASLVGVAIALDSSLGRGLNGVGGILWLAGALVLLRRARGTRPSGHAWLVLGITVVALSSLLSPRDVGAAAIGFFVGGWVVALVVRPVSARLSMVGLVPALWLPTHLGVAALRALYRALADRPADIRTDPPPTAALVPLAMVLAALLGGLASDQIARRRQGGLASPPVADQGAS